MSELLEDQKQLYEKNLKLFKSRFSELYKLLEKKLGNLPENVEVLSCKGDISKKTGKYNNQLLHSAYNPEREGEKLLQAEISKNQNADVLVFYGFGLGYLPLAAAKNHKNKTLVFISVAV